MPACLEIQIESCGHHFHHHVFKLRYQSGNKFEVYAQYPTQGHTHYTILYYFYSSLVRLFPVFFFFYNILLSTNSSRK